MKKVYFAQRLLAYVIDIIIVTSVVALLTSLIPRSESYNIASDKIYDEYVDIIQNSENTEDMLEKFDALQGDLYIIGKEESITSLLSVALYIVYYGACQYYLNGQTLGKKVTKIKIVGKKKKEVSQVKFLLRAVLTYTLFVNVFEAIIYNVANSTTYIYFLTPFISLGYLYNIINIGMVVFKKDGRGLSDLICDTEVISAE